MPTAYSPAAARSVITVPAGPDNVNLALLLAAVKSTANRAEWNSKKLVDVQHASATQNDLDLNSASFVDLTYALASMTFTDVSAGDIILLDYCGSWQAQPFTADGTDPFLEMRWLVGAADATITPAGAYPKITWGSTVVGTDERMMAFRSVFVASAPAVSLVAKAQGRGSASHLVAMPFAQTFGVHIRLGAA